MPSIDFSRSVAANLSYWLESSRELDDSTLHRMDEERHNLFRAAQFGLGLAETRCDAAGLILQIYPLIERRGYWRGWIPLLENAVEGCAESDLELSIHLLDRLGQCYRLNRQWQESLLRHEREAALSKQLADRKLLAKAHLNLGTAYWSLRQYDEAVEYAEQALAGFTDTGGDAEQFGATTTILGLIALGRDELETAEGWLESAIEAYRSIDSPALLARSLMNLMILMERGGRIEEALATGQEALAVLETTEHELDKVGVELTLGTLYMDLGRWSEAEAAYKRADSPALRRSGNAYLMALAANNLGSVFLEQGRLEESEQAMVKSIRLARQSGGRLMLANSLGSMAETQMALQHPAEALPYLDEAIVIASEFPDDGWGREIVEKYSEMKNELRV